MRIDKVHQSSLMSELDHRSNTGVIVCLSSVSQFAFDVDVADNVSRLASALESFPFGFGKSFKLLPFTSRNP